MASIVALLRPCRLEQLRTFNLYMLLRIFALSGGLRKKYLYFQILVEVVADYMGRLCRRIAEDKEYCQLSGSVNGFPDSIERVFREHLGLRSVLSLQVNISTNRFATCHFNLFVGQSYPIA